MLMYELIKSKRDGQRLDGASIDRIIRQYVDGAIPDYQMAALLMAIYFRGMETGELAHWTRAMIQSGETIHFGASGAYVDKHSTGGVGDKISLPLAPLAAELGVRVPMISGRGLGHTGGTLDKLESIPGFRPYLDVSQFKAVVDSVGCCIIGQTDNLVPADKMLYALRDVTATVDSIPLISSSILSKKTASGIRGLVMDVKAGSGAFMKSVEAARELAETLVALGGELGLQVRAYITNMNQPLGRFVGNALEVRESIDILLNRGPSDTTELTLEFAAAMAHLAGTVPTIEDARVEARKALESGRAAARFEKMLEAQGGNPGILSNLELLPQASDKADFVAPEAGFIGEVDSERVGQAVVELGGGRKRIEDPVDPAVGLEIHKRVGDPVNLGEPIATLYYSRKEDLEGALKYLQRGYQIVSEKGDNLPLVFDTLTADSIKKGKVNS